VLAHEQLTAVLNAIETATGHRPTQLRTAYGAYSVTTDRDGWPSLDVCVCNKCGETNGVLLDMLLLGHVLRASVTVTRQQREE
jgi:hypothetical protein